MSPADLRRRLAALSATATAVRRAEAEYRRTVLRPSELADAALGHALVLAAQVDALAADVAVPRVPASETERAFGLGPR